jgi:hypothetical protein
MQTGSSGFYEIKIENFSFEFTNLVSEIRITEHAMYSVPTCTLTLVDISSILNNELALRDGTKLNIRIGKTKEKSKSFDFIVYNSQFGTDSGSTAWIINCILDVPLFTHQVLNLGIKGTTNEVLSQVATKCGLAYTGTPTDDSQNWINFGTTAPFFVQNLVDHGYVNDTSCMMVACNGNKQLIYRNLTESIAKTENVDDFYINVRNPGQDIQTNQCIIYTNSGFRNMWNGLTFKRKFDGICGESFLDKLKIDKAKKSKYLSMNNDIRATIDYSRTDTTDFNVGNVHNNYFKAAYNNLRRRGLFSIYADILLLEEGTVATLLDQVYLHSENIRYPDKPTEEDGKWIVLSITRVLRGGMVYGEKLTLMKPYINNTGVTNLVEF